MPSPAPARERRPERSAARWRRRDRKPTPPSRRKRGQRAPPESFGCRVSSGSGRSRSHRFRTGATRRARRRPPARSPSPRDGSSGTREIDVKQRETANAPGLRRAERPPRVRPLEQVGASMEPVEAAQQHREQRREDRLRAQPEDIQQIRIDLDRQPCSILAAPGSGATGVGRGRQSDMAASSGAAAAVASS